MRPLHSNSRVRRERSQRRHSGECRNPEQTWIPYRRTTKKNDKAKRQIQNRWIPACSGMTIKTEPDRHGGLSLRRHPPFTNHPLREHVPHPTNSPPHPQLSLDKTFRFPQFEPVRHNLRGEEASTARRLRDGLPAEGRIRREIHLDKTEKGVAISKLRHIPELLSNVVYSRLELGGLPAGFLFVHPVDEPHVGNHVRQMTQAA